MDTAVLVTLIGVITNLAIAFGGYVSTRDARAKIRAESELVEAEKKKLNVEYWEKVARDLRDEMTATNDRYRRDIRQLRSAFEYLCAEVKGDYPVAVSIAHRLASGEMEFKRKSDDTPDITESHE